MTSKSETLPEKQIGMNSRDGSRRNSSRHANSTTSHGVFEPLNVALLYVIREQHKKVPQTKAKRMPKVAGTTSAVALL